MVYELIQKASSKCNVCLYYVTHCLDCVICTDSAGNKRYLVGRLDNGEIFVEKIPKENLQDVYDEEERL